MDSNTELAAECTCLEVNGEDPDCPLHGDASAWAVENMMPHAWQQRVLDLRELLADALTQQPADHIPDASNMVPAEQIADGALGVTQDQIDAVSEAIEKAQCLGREGPYGGYDFGHNTAFYGPEPKDGRYVIRDFRDPQSPDWGKWVHQTHDKAEHEAMFELMTKEHIALAAIRALQPQKGVAGHAEEITVKPAENCQKQVAGCGQGNHLPPPIQSVDQNQGEGL